MNGATNAAANGSENGDDAGEPTTPVYGGGVLIFDEYGKLKYHVHNDVFGSRQTGRLQYLWDVGQLRAGTRRSAHRGPAVCVASAAHCST